MTFCVMLSVVGLLASGCENESPKSAGDARTVVPETRPASKPASQAGDDEAAATTSPVSQSQTPAGTQAAEPAPAPPAQSSPPAVVIETTLGNIVVELTPDRTPLTVENFLRYVDDGFYSGTIFHRVINGFMIQGGGFTPDLQQKPTREPVRNESDKGLSNTRGTIAMARTEDLHSATSQFYINVVDNARLDTYGGGYTVFGRVVEGMDVVDAIAQVPVRPQAPSFTHLPVRDVVIQAVRRK